jgi:TonB family protein
MQLKRVFTCFINTVENSISMVFIIFVLATWAAPVSGQNTKDDKVGEDSKMAAFVRTASTPPEWSDHMTVGTRFLRDKRFKEAEIEFKSALAIAESSQELYPERVLSYKKIAAVQTAQKHFEAAQDELDRAFSITEKFDDVSMKSEILSELKEVAEAACKPEAARSYGKQLTEFENQISSVKMDSYQSDLVRQVRSKWYPPKQRPSYKIVAEFHIHRNGRTSGLYLEEPRLDDENLAALNAVRNAAPFTALPNGAPATIAIEWTFEYKMSDSRSGTKDHPKATDATTIAKHDWFIENTKRKIVSNWRVSTGSTRTGTVQFRVKKDGTLDSIASGTSTGNKQLDTEAVTIIKKSAPFAGVVYNTPVQLLFTFRGGTRWYFDLQEVNSQ